MGLWREAFVNGYAQRLTQERERWPLRGVASRGSIPKDEFSPFSQTYRTAAAHRVRCTTDQTDRSVAVLEIAAGAAARHRIAVRAILRYSATASSTR